MINRRGFSLSAAGAVGALASLAAGSALAQARRFRQGVDYRRLSTPVVASGATAAGKVEVIEFFWYGCGHCHAFEPVLAAWLKTAPKRLQLQRVPIAFDSRFVPQQKLFYTLEALGQVQALHAKVFHAIHVEKKDLAKDEEILAWAAAQGLDAARFKASYQSFGVASQVRRATRLQEAYGVEGVPSMGVAGRYYSDAPLAGSMQAVLEVVEYLATLDEK